MSLDQNLFTLLFAPSRDDPNVTDLVDPAENVHYRKARVPGAAYRIEVYDPLSQALLATASAPAATSKHKVIELHNPSKTVELRFAGTLTFKWRFQWEEHEFEWKREECYIIRKPDPAVLVAITKEAAGRIKTSSVQILDYNLNRFDIQDRKGLEIVILTALLTFQDANDAYHTPPPDPAASLSPSPNAALDVPAALALRPSLFGVRSRAPSETQPAPTGELGELALHTPGADGPPALPPKPARRTGVERVAEMHAVRIASGEGEANEVVVEGEGAVEAYAQYAEGMLNDDAMLFVTIRSAGAAEVPKVLQVVEETKRLRHKAGLDEDEALRQYVVYDTAEAKKARGPRRINLDDPGPGPSANTGAGAARAYAPPTSLSVHLSKIDMPELQPRAAEARPERRASRARQSQPAEQRDSKSAFLAWEREQEQERAKARERERERMREREREREQEKARKQAEKDAKKAGRGKKGPQPSGTPEPSRLAKPAAPTPAPTLTPTASSQTVAPYRAPSPYQHAAPPPSYPPPASAPPLAFPQPPPYYGGAPGFLPSSAAPSPAAFAPPGVGSARPTSWYGPAAEGFDAFGGAGGYSPGYLRQ